MKNNKRAKMKAQKSIRNRNVLREPSPLFEPNRTELKDFSNNELNLSAGFPISSKYIAMNINGTQYTANYSFTEKTGLKLCSKYFYLNAKRLLENIRKHSKSSFDWLTNRQEYMNFDNQEFVVRTFRFGDINSQYVLTDEVIETIRLVLMKQGSYDELSKLNSYSLEWDTKDAHLSNSIPKSRFKELLSEFSGNQSSITIIPDATSYYQYEKSFRETLCPVTLVNCDGKLVMSSVNAMFYIFQSVACGRTWGNQKQNPNVQNFKKAFYRVMDEYLELNDGLHVTLEKVESDILMLKECIKTNKLDETVLDYFVEKYAYTDEMPMSLHMKMLKTLGLEVPSCEPGTIMIPVQAARLVHFLQTINLICEPEMIKLKLKLIDGIGTKIQWRFIKHNVVDLKRAMIDDAEKYGIGIEVDGVTGIHTMKLKMPKKSIKGSDTEKLDLDDDDDKDNYFDLSPLQEWRRELEGKQNQRKANGDEDDGWNDYSIKEGFKIMSEDVVCVNEKLYISNHEIRKRTNGEVEENTRFFFLNATKFAKLLPAQDGVQFTRMPSLNLKTYSSSSDEFVVRSIQTRTGCYILTDEILELVPVLMEKQGVPVEKYEKRLKSYAENWKPDVRGVLNSVEVSFFKIIMNSFNVNRSFITIIPDPFHYKIINEVLAVEFIYTSFEDDIKIMSKEQGLLLMFQLVICGVNWKTKKCCLEKNQQVLNDFKKRFHTMTVLFTLRLRKGAFVTHEFVMDCAVSLLTDPIFTEKIVQQYSDFRYIKPSYDSLVTMEEHGKKCERFGIPENYQIFKSRQPPSVPKFILSTYNYVEMMEIIYPEYVFEEKKMLLEEIVLFLPKNLRRRGMEYFRCIVRRTINYCLSEQKEIQAKTMEALYKEEREAQERKRQIKKAEEAEQERLKKLKPTAVEEISDDNDPPPAAPEKPRKAKKAPKEPRPCQKCTENGVALLNARDDLKKIEITAKSNEKRAKRAEKVEKDLEDKKLEMEKLEKHIEDLKMALKDFDEQEDLAKVENTNILKDLESLERKIEVEAEKTTKNSRVNSRLIGKFNETQEELVIRESEREAKETRPTEPSEGPSTFHVPFVPALPTTDDPDLANNPDWVLEQWEKMKSDFEKDDVVQDEKEMIENLLAICEENLYVKNLAEYELFQFEATSRIYLQNIELNILKIQKTGDISNMKPLAKYPSLSAEFWVEYGKYMGS